MGCGSPKTYARNNFPIARPYCHSSITRSVKSFYGFHNNIDDVVAFFITILNKRHPPSVVEFNKILGSIVRMKQYPTVVSLVAHLEFRIITPSLVTLNILINCFCHLSQMGSAFSVLGKIVKRGYQLDAITGEVKKALEFHNKVRA